MRITAIALMVAAAVPAAAQNLFGNAEVEGMAQELMVKVAGATACYIEGVLPDKDLKTIVAFLLKANEKAFSAGSQKAVLIVKGLNLRPSSPACKVAAEKIAEAGPTYAEMAKMMREMGGVD
jgi:hypothetical protein